MRPIPSEAHKSWDILSGFFPRKVSPSITSLLLRTPVTPNQTTILWGVISTANAWIVYEAIQGRLLLGAAVFGVWLLTLTLDCVDGEIARSKHLVNPIGGKLLDGICHRATEYALLGAFVLAAWRMTGSALAMPIGLLISGDAMFTYAYERRLSALRVQAGFRGALGSREGTFLRGTTWSQMTAKQRLGTLTGLIQYPSAYFAIVLGNLSGQVLLAGLAALAAYKHFVWIRLIVRTLRQVKTIASEQAVASAAPAVGLEQPMNVGGAR